MPRNRNRNRPQNPLNLLLKSALKERFQAKAQVKITQVLTNPPKPDPVYDLYQDPRSWTPGRTISLVHRSPEGSETYLGAFTELMNERARLRRLVPFHGPHGSLPKEIVTGGFWLSPPQPEKFQETLDETERVRKRFHELLDSFR